LFATTLASSMPKNIKMILILEGKATCRLHRLSRKKLLWGESDQWPETRWRLLPFNMSTDDVRSSSFPPRLHICIVLSYSTVRKIVLYKPCITRTLLKTLLLSAYDKHVFVHRTLHSVHSTYINRVARGGLQFLRGFLPRSR
jgi:hypothetical protein